jgi:hypothetical protein
MTQVTTCAVSKIGLRLAITIGGVIAALLVISLLRLIAMRAMCS